MKEIEKIRLEKIYDLIPRYRKDGFIWKTLNINMANCPLKHIVRSFFCNEYPLECLDDKSFFIYMLDGMDNAEYNFESELQRNPAFDFFLDTEAELPTKQEYEKWPLKQDQFSVRYTHYIKKPKPFAPKFT